MCCSTELPLEPARSKGARLLFRIVGDTTGQATVEAAFLLPVLLLVFGLVAQPAVLLYNRNVMNAAAAETCRMLQTKTTDAASARAFAIRRLAAVPNVDLFHCGGAAGWSISFEEGGAGEADVKIVNKCRPLPLFSVSASLAGSIQVDGSIAQEVHAHAGLWPAWAVSSGADPAALAGEWK